MQVSMGVVYLLLPLVSGKVDWCSIKFSASPVYEATNKDMRHCHSCKDVDLLQTKDGPLCWCMLQNSIVCTPHNSRFYAVTGFLDLNAKRSGSILSSLTRLTLNSKYMKRHGLNLTHESQPLLAASELVKVCNFLHKCHYKKEKEPSNTYAVELPPELCRVVMSPLSANTLYSFSYIPSIMYRIQCMLLSVKLKVQLDPRMQQFVIPTQKGYIRGKEFNPKNWIIPGLGYDMCGNSKIFCLRHNDMYSLRKMSIKSKRIADTVEALIGTCLSAAGEQAAFLFIQSLGMDIEFHAEIPVERKITTKPEELINVRSLEIILGYDFSDPSLLTEALTHSSCQIAGTTACYQRLEFLGDAVLDHLFTVYYYNQYPECTPGLLTDLRSTSVNNSCYAHAAVKAGLNKHILHSSSELHTNMSDYLENIGQSFTGPSHGWEAGIGLPKVLADVIESIAGAIYLDSKRDKDVVWRSMKRLLEPLATAETIEPDPVKELQELCDRKSYIKSYTKTHRDGVSSVVAEVQAEGTLYSATRTGPNKIVAKKLAAKAVLKDLKAALP